MHLLKSFSFSPAWLHPIMIPLFRSVTFSFYRVSWLSRKVCRAWARVVTPPPSVCVSVLTLLHVGGFFPLASFPWWMQTRSVGCLFEDDAICLWFCSWGLTGFDLWQLQGGWFVDSEKCFDGGRGFSRLGLCACLFCIGLNSRVGLFFCWCCGGS